MEPPVTRYAKAGELHIAYQVFGEGPADVAVDLQWFSHQDGQWEVPPVARLLRRLAEFSRVVTFDKSGTGLSDPVAIRSLPSLEQWMDDLRAVLDAAGLQRVDLVGGNAGALMMLQFAATYPDRVRGLVLFDAYARLPVASDYPIGLPEPEVRRRLEAVDGWGQSWLLDRMAPTTAAEPGFREAWARFERQSASPGVANAMVRMMYGADLRAILPVISVPTLIIQRRDDARIPPDLGRYLAEHIPGARLAAVPGTDSLIWAGDQTAIVDEIEEFVTGVRPSPHADRVLATVLFADIVGSTELAARLGDRSWREVLADYHALARSGIERARGRLINTAGDGILATFDGPARAITFAHEFCGAVHALRLQVRVGLHAGEVELIGNGIGGIGVHIAARIMAIAGSDEVLVSSTVRDLVVGSGLEFTDRGPYVLKGVPGEWRVYALA